MLNAEHSIAKVDTRATVCLNNTPVAPASDSVLHRPLWITPATTLDLQLVPQ